MLQRPPPSDNKKSDMDSPAIAALKCAYELMQQRIISNPKDMMGVLLFGMEKSKFDSDEIDTDEGLAYPHCYLLTDLDVPDALAVKTLKAIAHGDEEADELLVPAKKRGDVTMSNLMFCANQIFTTKAPNFGSRRLFIITDNDDPHGEDKTLRSAATVRAKDLYDLGVVIELFPISTPQHTFDRTKFYDDLVYSGQDNPEGIQTTSAIKLETGSDGISLLSNLISDVNSKQVAKRALFSHLPFEIAPGLTISVKGYNVLQRQKPARSCYVWLNGERALIAKGQTTQYAAGDMDEETKKPLDETVQPVTKIEIKKAYKFGGEQVIFTKEEQKELKNFGPPVLRIVGFKPKSLLENWHSVTKSTFIYPSEEGYVGSTRTFSALWEKLLKSDTMGLAWYIARANANPSIVAILPGKEVLDPATGRQVRSAGLWVYPLPYADDIRQSALSPKNAVASDALVDALAKVVGMLQLPNGTFEPSRYPNPALQWHYKILQAMALEEEIPEFTEKDDKTLPRAKQIDKRAGEYVIEWGVMLEKEHRRNERDEIDEHILEQAGVKKVPKEPKSMPARKRKAATDADDDEPAPKKAPAKRGRKVKEEVSQDFTTRVMHDMLDGAFQNLPQEVVIAKIKADQMPGLGSL